MDSQPQYTYIRNEKGDTWAVYDAKGQAVDWGWHSRTEAINRAKRIGGKARKIKAYIAQRTN